MGCGRTGPFSGVVPVKGPKGDMGIEGSLRAWAFICSSKNGDSGVEGLLRGFQGPKMNLKISMGCLVSIQAELNVDDNGEICIVLNCLISP